MSHWAFCLQAVTANPARVADSRSCCYLLVVGIKSFLTSFSGEFHIPVLQAGPWEGGRSPHLPLHMQQFEAGRTPLHTVTSAKGCLTLTPLTSLWGQESSTWRDPHAMGWSFGTAASTQSLARIPVLTSNEKLNTIKTISSLYIIMQTPATLIPCWESFTRMWILYIAEAGSAGLVPPCSPHKRPHLSALHISRHVALGAASICRGTLTSSSWSL